MKSYYSFSETISNIYSLIITKIFYKKARLIRRPVYIRGKKNLVYGSGFTTGHACRFDLLGEDKALQIGKNCIIGDNVHIVAYEKVIIGDDVLMASKVFISDTNHGCSRGSKQEGPDIPPNDRVLSTCPVKIGDRVWIGENVVILSGADIGNGCIIGANSVITGEIPDNSIVVGAPGRIIKKWNERLQIWERV